MNDEATFLHAMQQHPEDNALRLVFADWLEERGDKRGELIRLLHTLTQSIDVPDRARLEERLRGLVASGVIPVGPFVTNSIGMKFAWIPAGTFKMGSIKEKVPAEKQHQVTLTRGFYLAIYPVTQAPWREIMGNNPSRTIGESHPVEQVSRDECQEFLLRLSNRESHVYRLPTEAEWEYACRAGTTTPFSFGETISTDQANYNGDDVYPYSENPKKGSNRGKTTPVGNFPANAWGLHDMHGNVWERCSDGYAKYSADPVVDPQVLAGRGHVLRGGSYGDHPVDLRSAFRTREVRANRDDRTGFRAAMTSELRQT
jgi:formylglycine-generating enzyme